METCWTYKLKPSSKSVAGIHSTTLIHNAHTVLRKVKKKSLTKLITRQSLKRRDMSQHNLVSAQTSNVCITRHAALNAIACMCQTICDVTSSNVLGRLVQYELELASIA